MNMRKRVARAAFALMVLAGAIGTAYAESLTWYFRSDHPNIVSLEVYSQSRNHVWPGNGDAYVLDDWDVHSFPLSCRSGEKICYGAWVRNESNSYWGAGYDGIEACDDCCYYCEGGSTPVIVLNP